MPWWRSRGWHGREDVGGEGGERRWGRRASETSGGDPRIHYVSSPSTGGGRGGRRKKVYEKEEQVSIVWFGSLIDVEVNRSRI